MNSENEKLRGLLGEVRVLLANSSYKISGTAALMHSIDAALSQQAELTGPGLAFALTGGRHGEPDEPARAQDERHSGLLERIDAAIKAFTSGRASMHVPPEPTDVDFVLEECRKFIVATRPAQTEQKPIRLPQRADTSHGDAFDTQLAEAYNAALDEVARLNAAPIAQAAPKREQRGLVEAVKEAVKYLDENYLNQISSRSRLHLTLRAALAAQGGE